MNNKWMNATLVLTIVLISLISISSAAVPRAMPDLYQGQCGVELSVPAPGLLANDIPISSSKPLHVLTWTTPSAGTLTVDPSGSFVFTPPPNIPSGTYVYFYYTATDGTTVTSQALVKIAVSCKCTGSAKNVNVCLGTAITPAFLISQGAGCMGCRDVTPTFDLSKIPAQPVAGACYPYTVSCPGIGLITGQVCFSGSCAITSVPFTVCSSVTPTTSQIISLGKVTCSCDTNPVISNIHIVGDHWEYTITCQSTCGSATATGIVNIQTPCVPTSKAFTICSGVTPTAALILTSGSVTCGTGVCDTTPAISNIHAVGDHWEYTITCTTALGCSATATGIVNIQTPCVPTSKAFTICSGVTPTAALILASGSVTCGTGVCDITPAITNIHIVSDHWEYTITCTTASGCSATATGIVNIQTPCVPTSKAFAICSGVTPTVALILASGSITCGTGVCDTTPAITNIHIVSDHWEYTITCTTASGCSATATGVVNIQTPCVPTSKAFTICSGVTPTAALILASGSVTCGTGVCDTTPAISNIHGVGDHWEYTITCTTASGCTATATGIVNIQTPCVPTSKAFAICSGVTPTAALILASGSITCGTGICDTTPAISNIHTVGDHWEYTITCTTALGCSATATGIVNIQTPCVPTSKAFTICSGVTPTAALILASGSITCGTGVCDTTPAISNIHTVSDHWEYTITCTTASGCSATATGIVNIETPCTPTSTPFTVCKGVTPTVEMIQGEGSVTCGTGVCDTTPEITNIHAVEDHWEYTITCKTASGCSATATGIVNVQTACAPTSKAFTVCPGVTPTEDQILENGAVSCGGVCDATPVISGIHKVVDRWEYTITCTTALGCIATGTGIVNIGQPCNIDFTVFPIPTSDCPGNVLPTAEEIVDLGGVTCGCDATPVISNIHWVSTPPAPDEWTGEYTITCTSADGCTSSTTGQFNNANCDCCGPTSEPFTICKGLTPTADLILAKGVVSCGPCDATPAISDIHIVGDHWEYTITCQSNCGSATATGIVNIEPVCVPTSVAFTICKGVTPTVAMIEAEGSVTCGTGVCDTTPVISGIHLAGDHWEYTITCTTALGCSATATGIVNIGPVCVPTSVAFTICKGVTPTVEMIEADGSATCGTGVCDATPVISGIHLAGDHWEYTITCTSSLGCVATATGIVNIGPVCAPTSEAFAICKGVTPTVEMIEAEGSVDCGTGVCDTTPVISGIHLAGDHWEYTITCTTALNCKATATGRVNIETPCVPTSEAFTICKGVTPTADMILDRGVVSCGACDATPTISNIHTVGDHWVYTITCTTALGCTATGTGIVKIGQPCKITFFAFPLPPENCPGNKLPTIEQIMELGVVDCGCDATPVISNIHWVSTPPGGEWTGEYTITCTSADGCISTEKGQFNNADCASCSCAPTAPNLCGCRGYPFPMALFKSLGGGCHPASGCDVTPNPVIDDSKVDYTTSGHSYPYTVTCPDCNGNNVATGYIYIRAPLCGPGPNGGLNCICPTHCP